MLGYTSQDTSRRESDTIEESFLETQEFETSRYLNFFPYQNQSHGEQSNLDLKCNYSNEENWREKFQQKRDQKDSISISVVGRYSSVEVLKSSHSQSPVEISSFERTFVCGINSEKLNRFTSLLKHNCKPSPDKHLHHGIHQENFYEMGHFSQQKCSDNKDRAFQCTVWDKFLLENDPEQHMYTHNEVKSFQCDVCKKTFSKQNSLTRHMLTHYKEKPFQCNVFGKQFFQKGNLKVHMRTHTGEKPFQCVVCDERFSQKCSLNRHMRAHTREKPFVGQKRF
ncbi:gastrula zinc finger protein XlCGF57.1 [Trichonephila clavipes]|nr:gastrula zinc finger protein XlCGF57.1 [Trichonephila clavipes]